MLLYAITDRTLLRASKADEAGRLQRLVELAREWAAAGVDFIQVREKDLDAEALGALTRSIGKAVRELPGSRTRLLLNVSTVELARLAAEAGWGQDGLHLGGAMATMAKAARMAGSDLLSVACHSPEDVLLARDQGADLALFAPVFEKRLGPERERLSGLAGTGPLPGRGLAMLAEACAAAGAMPVIALGGVTVGNAGNCRRAGAAGVAGIRLFLGSDAPGAENGAASWQSLCAGRP